MNDDMKKAREVLRRVLGTRMRAFANKQSLAGATLIAAALREARKQSWDEGYGEGYSDASRSACFSINPYGNRDETE